MISRLINNTETMIVAKSFDMIKIISFPKYEMLPFATRHLMSNIYNVFQDSLQI